MKGAPQTAAGWTLSPFKRAVIGTLISIAILIVSFADIANAMQPRWRSQHDHLVGRYYMMPHLHCKVRRWPDQAHGLMRTIPGTVEEEEARVEFMSLPSGCPTGAGSGVWVAMNHNLYRGYIANELYGVDYLNREQAEWASDVMLPPLTDDEVLARLTDTTDREAELIRIFADCVVVRQPQEVHRFVRTPGFGLDTRRIATFSDSFAPCLYEGMELTLGHEALWAALAEALYHRSGAADRAASQPEATN